MRRDKLGGALVQRLKTMSVRVRNRVLAFGTPVQRGPALPRKSHAKKITTTADQKITERIVHRATAAITERMRNASLLHQASSIGLSGIIASVMRHPACHAGTASDLFGSSLMPSFRRQQSGLYRVAGVLAFRGRGNRRPVDQERGHTQHAALRPSLFLTEPLLSQQGKPANVRVALPWPIARNRRRARHRHRWRKPVPEQFEQRSACRHSSGGFGEKAGLIWGGGVPVEGRTLRVRCNRL